MVARSTSRGHKLIFRNGTWVYEDLKRAVRDNDPCARCGRKPVPVRVRIPADLSSIGKAKWRVCFIDACIAPFVKAFQKSGVDMRGSCCGHGEMDGEVELQDGRMLVVKPNAQEYYRGERIIYLEWKDSTATTGWQPQDSAEKIDLRCVSVGLFVREDDEKITISTTRAGSERPRVCYADQMTIPKSAIIRRRWLKP